MQNELMYFLHIPKTSGTSFMKFLSQYFKNERIFPGSLWTDVVSLSPINWNNYDLVRGHFGYDLTKYLPEKTRVITMLRDPVERTISQYHHIMSDPFVNHKIDGKEIKEIGGGELGKMLEDSNFSEYIGNTQVKHLGAKSDFLYEFQSNNNAYSSIAYLYAKHANEESTETILSNAKARLKQAYFFGLQEYFEQSYLLLGQKMSIQPIYDGSRNMVFEKRPPKESFSTETIDKVKSINTLDQELYDFAKKLFIDEYINTFSDLALSLRKPLPMFDDLESVKALISYQRRIFH